MITPKLERCYMNIAIEFSKLSHAKRKKTGSIIVSGTRIISQGYNGTPAGMSNDCEDENGNTYNYVLHAEANAILKLAKDGESGKGSTLFVTLSPCIECAKMIIQTGIIRVIYIEDYRIMDGVNLLLNNGVEVKKLNI